MIEIHKFRAMLEASQQKYVNSIPKIKVQNPILGELETVHVRDTFNPSYITTELRNKLGKVLGKETFSLKEDETQSTGMTLEVMPEYRQKGFNFGEILRLSSIMVMLKNKIKSFEIYSKNSAIYFHSKYKFEPAITRFNERDNALESIIHNTINNTEFLEFKEEAEALVLKSSLNKDSKSQRNLCIETNKLLKKYIEKVLEKKNRYKEHPFLSGITMKLTEENILANKKLFNSLFKKHNIDYTI